MKLALTDLDGLRKKAKSLRQEPMPKESNDFEAVLQMKKPYVDKIAMLMQLNKQKVQQSERQTVDTSSRARQSSHKRQPTAGSKPVDFKNQGVPTLEVAGYVQNYKNFLRQKLPKPAQRQEGVVELQKMQGEDQEIDRQQFLRAFERSLPANMREKLDQLYGLAKDKKGVSSALKHAFKYMYEFRMQEFVGLAEQGRVSKTAVQDYLFTFPSIMMLFNIRPLTLSQQISQFITQQPGLCSFEEFSSFLVTPRPLVPQQQYSRERIEYARVTGPALQRGPIKSSLVCEERVIKLLRSTFDECDMFGNNKVQRGILAIKLLQNFSKQNLLEQPVFKIENNGKVIPFSKFLFELTYEPAREEWTWQDLERQFSCYRGLRMEPKEKVVQRAIMAGKIDGTYICLLPQTTVSYLRTLYEACDKSGTYFVPTAKFVQKIKKSPKYQQLKGQSTRKEVFGSLPAETFGEALQRMLKQADQYIDFNQFYDFICNRGRPSPIEAQLRRRADRLKAQLQQPESDDQQQERHRQRKKQLKQIRHSKNITQADEIQRKKVSVTVPQAFSFQKRPKAQSIREKKLKEDMSKRLQDEEKAKAPFKARPMPQSVSANYYQTLLKQQQIQRRERKAKFKEEAKACRPVPDSLFKRKENNIPHCWQVGKPYKFRARALPWFCEVELLQKFKQRDQGRYESIFAEVKYRHEEVYVDSVGNQIEARIQGLKQKWASQQQKRVLYRNNASHSPVRTKHFEVPNFKLLHQKFAAQLQSSRKDFKPTVPRALTLSVSRERPKREQPSSREMSSRRKRVYYKVSPPAKSTLKHDALANLRRTQLQSKQYEAQKAEQEYKYLQQKRKAFARQILKEMPQRPNNQEEIRRQVKQKRKLAKLQQLDAENQLRQIYERVSEKPLLALS